MTDTDGNLLGLVTHTAEIQDRGGAPDVIAQACESFPTLLHTLADGGYAGAKLQGALKKTAAPTVEIVKRPPGVTSFVVIARLRVVTAPLPGSAAVADLQRVGKRPLPTPTPGYSSPPSEDQPVTSQEKLSWNFDPNCEWKKGSLKARAGWLRGGTRAD